MGRRILVVVVLLAAVIGGLARSQANGFNPLSYITPTPGPDQNQAQEPAVAPPAEPAAVGASGIPAGAEPATIEYVHDGDTLFLTDGRKVRLLGINTPEVGDNLECYGDEAASALRQLLPEGTDVWVLADVEPLDQYGRSLLFVYLGDGTNVNLAQIGSGAAEVVQYDPNWMLQPELRAAEDAARGAGLGLWGACR